MRDEEEIKVTYDKLFWLFIAGSLAGVLLEGLFSIYKRGAWESHVVSVWGPFCIIYGIGFAGCYAGYAAMQNKSRFYQFVMFGSGGCIIELISGAILDFGLHMRAWNYTRHFMNFRGYVSLSMFFIWGFIGIAFSYAIPYIDKVFKKMQGNGWQAACNIFTVFMIINLTVTGVAIHRWSNRHYGKPAVNRIEQIMDSHYNDDYMSKRFCEWKFIK